MSTFAFRSAIVIAAGLAALPATADPAATATAAPDLVSNLIDPYQPGAHRRAFFEAAGVDMELNADEFNALKPATTSFRQPYDQWDALKSFDRNRNGSLDWFEVDAYRQQIRARVIKAYDTDSDKRLTGDERTKANADLLAGKLPAAEAKPAATSGSVAGGSDDVRDRWAELRSKYDADGDGELSEAERDAMRADMRKRWEQEALAEYDTDGDGELSREERRAMRRDRSQPWEDHFKKQALKHFDADGDGEISNAERADIERFGKQWQTAGRAWETLFQDVDGDGTISEGERAAARQQMMRVGMAMMMQAQSWMDSDGDGIASAAEQKAFRENMATRMISYMETFGDRFDENADGRLDEEERTAMIAGFDFEVRDRHKKADTDGDGVLSDAELATFFQQWGRDLKIIPSK